MPWDEPRLLADPSSASSICGPPPWDHDRLHSDQFRSTMSVRKAFLQRLLRHRIAAVLHDDGAPWNGGCNGAPRTGFRPSARSESGAGHGSWQVDAMGLMATGNGQFLISLTSPRRLPAAQTGSGRAQLSPSRRLSEFRRLAPAARVAVCGPAGRRRAHHQRMRGAARRCEITASGGSSVPWPSEQALQSYRAGPICDLRCAPYSSSSAAARRNSALLATLFNSLLRT